MRKRHHWRMIGSVSEQLVPQQIHHKHISCFPTVLYNHCRWASFRSSKNSACTLTQHDSSPQQLHMLRHVVQGQLELVPCFSFQVGALLGQMHVYFQNFQPQLSHLPHNTCNHASLDAMSHLILFLPCSPRMHVIRTAKKTQRNEIAKSLFATECSLSCSKIAQHTLHHATPLRIGAHPKKNSKRTHNDVT